MGDLAREAALACNENQLAAGVNLGWALYSTGRFAEAIAVYGAEQGEAIGAVADLEAFAERGIRPQAVREILDTYLPKYRIIEEQRYENGNTREGVLPSACNTGFLW